MMMRPYLCDPYHIIQFEATFRKMTSYNGYDHLLLACEGTSVTGLRDYTSIGDS
jgi:hypothetical protein